VGIIKSKKERTITEGDSGLDQEGQAHGGTNFINGTMIEEEWRENFRMSKTSLLKLAEELRPYINSFFLCGKLCGIMSTVSFEISPYLSTQDFQSMLLAICFVLYFIRFVFPS